MLSTPLLFEPAVPFVVTGIPEKSINKDSGLLPGDRIIAIDTIATAYLQDAAPVLKSKAGQETTVTVQRDSAVLSIPLNINQDGTIGIYTQYPHIERLQYSFLESIPAGFVKAYEAIVGQIKDMRLVAKPSTGAYKQVRSVIGMTEVMPTEWNWAIFINIMAMISIVLGVMNLLPIPALDGGHMVFTIYEMITRKKPSDNFMYVMQLIGMFFIFGLMFLACGNDIARLLK
jgi:regulator of sigma E protease